MSQVNDLANAASARASFESFESAFRGGVCGARRECECGVTYWDSYNGGYDWDEGEVEALAANPNARPLPHAVGTVEFDGRIYVDGCTCWHERALRVIGYINAYAAEIASFLSKEKSRKQREAECSPVVTP